MWHGMWIQTTTKQVETLARQNAALAAQQRRWEAALEGAEAATQQLAALAAESERWRAAYERAQNSNQLRVLFLEEELARAQGDPMVRRITKKE